MARIVPHLCSIIIPVYNQVQYTNQCIQSIIHYASTVSIEIIVVDNGSTDETQETFSSFTNPDISFKYFRFTENQGFVAACNQGAIIATGETLCFLNNDTIVTSGWLEELHLYLTDSVGMVGPKLVYPRIDDINHAGYGFLKEGQKFVPLFSSLDASLPELQKDRSAVALLGACILLRADVFKSVGGFDDFGLEDIDLCLKLKLRGFDIAYRPRCKVFHYGSVTFRSTDTSGSLSRSNTEFRSRWDLTKLMDDFTNVNAEVGFSCNVISPTELSYTHKDDPGYEIYNITNQVLERGDIDAASSILKERMGESPDNKRLLVLQTNISLMQNDFNFGIEVLQKLLQLRPRYLDGYYVLARLAQLTGQHALLQDTINSIPKDEFLPFDLLTDLRSLYSA
jgi:GT2 family glycosyltransferase